MNSSTADFAIIGAGPYGLSLAAHLRDSGLAVQIFGVPMESWRERMPRGMMLKSEGFASNLSAPGGAFTLRDYCAERGISYLDAGWPVPLQTFIDYGEEFQRRYVAQLDQSPVESLTGDGADGFVLRTARGAIVRARKVVVAVGISHFAYLPPMFAAGAADSAVNSAADSAAESAARGAATTTTRAAAGSAATTAATTAADSAANTFDGITHSSQHVDVGLLRGRRVAVVGAGSSALDLAVLAHEAGADVVLLARRKEIDFHRPPSGPRSLIQRLLRPPSGLGPGWRSRLCTDLPLVFHNLPLALRQRIVDRHLGPAAGWFVAKRANGQFPMYLGTTIQAVRTQEQRIGIVFTDAEGARHEMDFDHVIAATGYRPSLRRLQFIDESLRSRVRSARDAPILDRYFESSLRGLYFVGPIGADSFGPLLRFAFGAAFTAKRLARHLAKNQPAG